MSLQNALLKMGLLELNPKQMQRLVDDADDEMIRWSYEKGKWDVRLMAVDYFKNRKNELSVPFLKMAMDDDIEVISQTAIAALEALSDSEEIQQLITEKRQYWVDVSDYREERRNRTHAKTSAMTESKERGSKKTLDNVRNMLKKPINGGKWF